MDKKEAKPKEIRMRHRMKGIFIYIDAKEHFKLPFKDISLIGVIAIPIYYFFKLLTFAFVGIRFKMIEK